MQVKMVLFHGAFCLVKTKINTEGAQYQKVYSQHFLHDKHSSRILGIKKQQHQDNLLGHFAVNFDFSWYMGPVHVGL